MSDKIISVFGSYDFLGKSLPGTAFLLGLYPLLPKSMSIPPLLENFLVFIAFLVSVLLLGTLVGEAVHTVALLFESTIAWGSKRIRNTIEFVSSIVRSVGAIFTELSDSSPDSTLYASPRLQEDESKKSKPPNIAQRLLGSWKSNIKYWLERRYKDIAYTLWPHRAIFTNRLEPWLDDPNPQFSAEKSDIPFTQRELINRAKEEYEVRNKKDIQAVYNSIMTELNQADYERAFTLQSRYAFCRGMWFSTLFISIIYTLTAIDEPSFTIAALSYPPILNQITDPQIGLIAIILFGSSAIFAYASGNYKKYYIEYIMASIYVKDNAD